MCFGGGGSKEPTVEKKPPTPDLDPKFYNPGDRQRALYLAEGNTSSITPVLGGSGTAGKPANGVQ